MRIGEFIGNFWNFFKSFPSRVWNLLYGLINDIKKDMIIRKAQKEVEKQLEEFRDSFDSLLNRYYDFLPLPQGKSIIENTVKSGKKVYVVVFNDTRNKNVRTVEIYSDTGFFALPPHYQVLQKINLSSFLDKVNGNIFKSFSDDKSINKFNNFGT